LRCALLTLPDTFSSTQLFEAIASLSYAGDVRMGVAENPNKVKNLVATQLPAYQSLYQPFLDRYVQPSSASDATSLTVAYAASSSSSDLFCLFVRCWH
jgi:hypothetical protein